MEATVRAYQAELQTPVGLDQIACAVQLHQQRSRMLVADLHHMSERYHQLREAAGRNGIGALPAADRWEVPPLQNNFLTGNLVPGQAYSQSALPLGAPAASAGGLGLFGAAAPSSGGGLFGAASSGG